MKAAAWSVSVSACVFWAVVPCRTEAGWLSRRDDCAPGTRHARAEWVSEHCAARALADVDCAGLTAYAESWRSQSNQRIQDRFLRPIAELPRDFRTLPRPQPLPEPVPSESPVFSRPKPSTSEPLPEKP